MSDEPIQTAKPQSPDLRDRPRPTGPHPTQETPMSTTEEQPPVHAEDDDAFEEAEQADDWEDQPLTRRPRRRLLTPLTALLFAILVGAGGFIAGVQWRRAKCRAHPAAAVDA